jgi:hypothetical protein
VGGGSTMDLGVARVAHACRKNGRGRGCIGSNGRTTRRVHKRKCRRVEEGRCVRRAGTTKDATTLSTMLQKKVEV